MIRSFSSALTRLVLRTSRRFARSERGAVTVMFIICSGVMLACLLGGIDVLRVHMLSARLQMSLDQAALSGGANLAHYPTLVGQDLANWQADTYNYLMSNMPQGYLNGTVNKNSFTATVSGSLGTGQTIALTINATLPLISAGLLPLATQTVTAQNKVLRQNESNLELAMALDNTGSMSSSATGSGGASKLSGLITASKGLVNLLYGDGTAQTAGSMYVGLVPFASTVNVGSIATAPGWLGAWPSFNTKGIVSTNWGGCIVEPRGMDNSLAPAVYDPSTKPFKPYYYNVPTSGMTVINCPSGTAWKDCSSKSTSKTNQPNVPLSLNSSGVPNPNGDPTGNLYGTAAYTGLTSVWAQNSNGTTTYDQNASCIAQRVTFLTANKTTLLNAIGSMKAAGSTIIPLGLLWGWRMLSPQWKGSAGWGSTTLPQDPAQVRGLKRVLIVLTDGQNQVSGTSTFPNNIYYNGLSGVGDATLIAPGVKRPDNTTLSNGRIDAAELHKNNPSDSSAGGAGFTDDLNAFQAALCTAIKNDGVTIYTITFGSDSSSSVAQQTMLACATDATHYRHAPDNAALQQIFNEIAGGLSELRLVQ
ncbi:MAG TPA: TadE/TadG family type IV pilus assembly protein [Paraburkholderia sp.]|nr:TadE/TadG family type IV pilus assembly protein [Paraburkholderia sp.]